MITYEATTYKFKHGEYNYQCGLVPRFGWSFIRWPLDRPQIPPLTQKLVNGEWIHLFREEHSDRFESHTDVEKYLDK